jgi:hypothetical protein
LNPSAAARTPVPAHAPHGVVIECDDELNEKSINQSIDRARTTARVALEPNHRSSRASTNVSLRSRVGSYLARINEDE